MTTADAILALLDAFPGLKVEQTTPGTKEAVMNAALRQSNRGRGVAA